MAHNSTVGMDITEVIPALDDRRGTTSQLAHMFVFDAIAAVS
jgi:arginase family enzyme